jgi:mannose-6-phosphate isomerase-like protein (cupin superfamily)
MLKYKYDSLLSKIPSKTGERFTHVLKNEFVEVFLYAPIGKDLQQPHGRDEFYVVSEGTGTFSCNGQNTLFKKGDLLYAPAGKEHRFEGFSDDLSVWVIFYGEKKTNMEEAIIKEYIESINEHNVDKIISLQSDDCILKDAIGNQVQGIEPLRKVWAGYFGLFSNYKIEVESISKVKEAIAVFGYAGGALKTDKTKQWRLPVSIRAQIKNGKVSLWQVYADTKMPFDLMDRK